MHGDSDLSADQEQADKTSARGYRSVKTDRLNVVLNAWDDTLEEMAERCVEQDPRSSLTVVQAHSNQSSVARLNLNP